jgi:hypothetical protein
MISAGWRNPHAYIQSYLRQVDVTHKTIKRRELLQLAAIALGAATAAGKAIAAACADPNGSDAGLRTSLHYTESATDPAQRCSACSFFSNPQGACGQCTIFSGPTNNNGHCDSFAART